MKLEDTIQDMMSEDWRDRLQAEYDQLNIRISKAEKEIKDKTYKDTTPSLLKLQLAAMIQYRDILEKRARMMPSEVVFNDAEREIDQNQLSDNVVKHDDYCVILNNTYALKNQKYGDSFWESISKYGLIAALTRISDKFNRLEQLIINKEDGSDTDESLKDTLLDMANYCIMTAMALDRLNEENK